MNIRNTGLLMATVPLLISLFFIGCGTDSMDDRGATVDVFMERMSFSPDMVEIQAGTTVRWINQSDSNHTVTSGEDGIQDGQFDSGSISPGSQFSYTFEEPGIFHYYSAPFFHAGMTGVVEVFE